MGDVKKWAGLFAAVVVALFIIHTFLPASIKTQLGIA